MKDFFISYNSADRVWAEWIAWQLEEAGFTTMLQAWDFRPGSSFVLEMDRAATEAARTVAVLSRDYVEALFTQAEWAAAFAQDPTGEKGTLLPVRVRECDPRGLLAQVIYIDLVGKDERSASRTLLEGVRLGRAKPTTAPAFPGQAARSVAEHPHFPGALPATCHLPHPRNRNFTGRKDLLKRLREALTSGTPAALTQAIHGLGGVGKTQLALEYAYAHAADYDIIWWVRSEEPAALASEYASLAGPLGLPEKDATDQREIVEAVRRWLDKRDGWLLVFDNAAEPTDLQGCLPQGAGGHVIITSRNLAWGAVARPLQVKVWKPAESVKFLLKRTKQKDRKAASALAEALGDLPLALEQAAAYIEATGATLASYVELFKARHEDLWAKEKPPLDYPATVATTWCLAMDRLCDESRAGAGLLNLCAFLAPDDTPCDLLRQGGKHLPELLAAPAGDELAFNEAVAALRRYSLVEVGDDALSVHPLVQAVTRDRLPDDARKTWVEAAVRLVNQAFPYDSDDVRTWPTCSRLLPHALSAAEHAEALAAAPDATARLLNESGAYLRGRAQFAQARTAFERALAIDEKAFGPDHPQVAVVANNLGSVLQDQGDLAGARAHFERALAIDEKAFGPDHPKVAIRINNLGLVLQALGDLAGARAHFERALAIDEKAHGPDHPEVATDVNNLGLVLQDLGDLTGARVHCERALRILREFLGEDHPKTVLVRNNLEALQELRS
ncbi:MAG TPA: FxSxx-COOH system tetratricopeptide repeat protein [Armatimonadota bacterium]|nr:FxSxx-COOH system tetratricopeptide repeat protein [Armatimonadota bacterium]